MVCFKCGHELKDGIKYCTKCGTKFSYSMHNLLQIFSIIISVIGIIGDWIILLIIQNLIKTNNYSSIFTYNTFQYIFSILIYTGIVFSIISLYMQKVKLSLIIGIILCAYQVILPLVQTLILR